MKLTPAQWKEILSAHEEEILDALRTAYYEAARPETANFGCREVVDIRYDGKISTYMLTQGTTDGEVWHGEAIEIADFEHYDPLDGWDTDDYLNFLEAWQYDAFVRWLVREGHILPEDRNDKDEIRYNYWRIRDWDPEVWDEIEEFAAECAAEDFDADYWFEQAILELEQQEAFFSK